MRIFGEKDIISSGNIECKGPEAGEDLVCPRTSKQSSVAGARRGRRRQ